MQRELYIFPSFVTMDGGRFSLIMLAMQATQPSRRILDVRVGKERRRTWKNVVCGSGDSSSRENPLRGSGLNVNRPEAVVGQPRHCTVSHQQRDFVEASDQYKHIGLWTRSRAKKQASPQAFIYWYTQPVKNVCTQRGRSVNDGDICPLVRSTRQRGKRYGQEWFQIDVFHSDDYGTNMGKAMRTFPSWFYREIFNTVCALTTDTLRTSRSNILKTITPVAISKSFSTPIHSTLRGIATPFRVHERLHRRLKNWKRRARAF